MYVFVMWGFRIYEEEHLLTFLTLDLVFYLEKTYRTD